MRPLTLGIIPYLNVLPLLEGLEEDFPKSQWVRGTPRELAGLLAKGEIDVAAVSTYEGLRGGESYRLVPGIGIGSDGAVRSVQLFSRLPLTQIGSVLLDRASLTSVNLARVLIAELLEISPRYDLAAEPIAPSHDWRGGEHDALVVIGDTALQWEKDFPHQLDLGAGWKQLTGLPFVFAGWWARSDCGLEQEHIEAFQRARDRGVKNLDGIARREAELRPEWKGREETLRSYFRNATRYVVGDREMEAIGLYREKLVAHGLLGKAESGADCEIQY
jgi:chorismate dehydratase